MCYSYKGSLNGERGMDTRILVVEAVFRDDGVHESGYRACNITML